MRACLQLVHQRCFAVGNGLKCRHDAVISQDTTAVFPVLTTGTVDLSRATSPIDSPDLIRPGFQVTVYAKCAVSE